MPDKRQKDLRKNIRSLTKQIGQALKVHDHSEADNLRYRRIIFIRALVEEYNEYFIIKKGKSRFVDYEEANQHSKKPENRKSIASARIISEMFQGREFLRARYKEFADMTPEKVQKTVMTEIKEQMNRMETVMNELLTDVGRSTIDFEEADSIKNGDFLDGIDMSSLE